MNLYKFSVLQASPIFTTKEFAIRTKVSVSSASRLLTNLMENSEIKRITKGVWINAQEYDIHPFFLTQSLLGKELGYVSLLSALHIHGLLSQIPPRIQIVTTGHSKVLKTDLGVFEFFQLKPELMIEGVKWSTTKLPFQIATPEKALLDVLYLSTRKGKRFASLPELEFKGSGIQKKIFCKLLENQNFAKPIYIAIKNRFENLRH